MKKAILSLSISLVMLGLTRVSDEAWSQCVTPCTASFCVNTSDGVTWVTQSGSVPCYQIMTTTTDNDTFPVGTYTQRVKRTSGTPECPDYSVNGVRKVNGCGAGIDDAFVRVCYMTCASGSN